MDISGTLTVNGTLSAEGANGSYTGAAGSINITANLLTGTGLISASAKGGGSYGGGGGRISLAGVSSDKFIGIIKAEGTKLASVGFAGTIYLNSAKRSNLTIGGSGNLSSLRLGSDDTNNYTLGQIIIKSGGLLEIGGNPILNANEGGAATIFANDIDIQTGGKLSADGLGFKGGPGGPGSQSNTGGTYGGQGGANTTSTYGSFTNPISLGSSGATAGGGGAIIIDVSGTVTISGTLSADSGNGSYDGAGGSINITANLLTGTGTISASSIGGSSRGGGGGRVSLANVTTDSFTGTLKSDGSKIQSFNPGYSGTIYLNSSRRNNLILGGAGNLSTLRLGTDSNNNYTFGAVVIQSGGLLEIDGHPLMNTNQGGAAVLYISSLDLQAGGQLNSDGLGFGGGPGFQSNTGGTYGGIGGGNTKSAYGSLTNPVNLGSQGAARGGGAIIISSTGTVTLNGTISANGLSTSYGGSGGTVNISCTAIAGSSTIRVNGGASTFGGGGGRIAIKLSSGTSFDSLSFEAFGGSTSFDGAAGTIYLEDANDGANKGELIIDNNGTSTAANIATNISSSVTDTSVGIIKIVDNSAAKLTIDQGGSLISTGSGTTLTIGTGTTFTNNGTLTLGGITFTNNGTFNLGSNSLVTYTGQSDDSSVTILTGTAYQNIGFTNDGTVFSHGMALDVNGNITITAGTLSSSGNNINIAGDWTNNGGYSASNTVIFDGTNQTISGSTTFNNFQKTDSNNNGSDVLLTFEDGKTQTIAGTLTLSGLDGDDRVNLVSDSPGTQWLLTANGSFAIDFVDVTDSDASGGNSIQHSNTIDGGNNLNWGFTETITWINPSDGNISTASNWDLGRIPIATDDILINGGSANITWDGAASSTANSLTLSGTYTGTVSLTRNINISSNIVVSEGILQTAEDASSTITVTNNFNINANGTVIVRRFTTSGEGQGQTISAANLTITGSLNADGKGFSAGQGPGAQSNTGGTHGGQGGANTKSTYGSFTNPTSLGSGGATAAGGGSIIINVSGNVTITGTLSADSGNGSFDGSGGSINITANLLTGTGTISASSIGGSSRGGGGGRVSLANVTSDSFTGTLKADGSKIQSSSPGYSGTIYLNSSKRNNLILGGAGNLSTLRLGTDSTNNYTFGTVVIQSGGRLEIDGHPLMNTNQGSAATLYISNLDVQAGGQINTDGLGFGGGPGFQSNTGGTYGGQGGSNTSSAYGSLTNPVNLGSQFLKQLLCHYYR